MKRIHGEIVLSEIACDESHGIALPYFPNIFSAFTSPFHYSRHLSAQSTVIWQIWRKKPGKQPGQSNISREMFHLVNYVTAPQRPAKAIYLSFNSQTLRPGNGEGIFLFFGRARARARDSFARENSPRFQLRVICGVEQQLRRVTLVPRDCTV